MEILFNYAYHYCFTNFTSRNKCSTQKDYPSHQALLAQMKLEILIFIQSALLRATKQAIMFLENREMLSVSLSRQGSSQDNLQIPLLYSENCSLWKKILYFSVSSSAPVIAMKKSGITLTCYFCNISKVNTFKIIGFITILSIYSSEYCFTDE